MSDKKENDLIAILQADRDSLVRTGHREKAAGMARAIYLIKEAIDTQEVINNPEPTKTACNHDFAHFNHKDSVCSKCGYIDKRSNE